jgi:hypothetical protein
MTNPPIDQQITFLYTPDLTSTSQFYENVMGLPLALDQGTGTRLCKKREFPSKNRRLSIPAIKSIIVSCAAQMGT